MIRSFWLGCLVVTAVLGLTQTASAQKLEWKAFDGKEPFYQKMVTKTEQKMTVMGMEVKQTQEQTFYMQWTPVKSDATTWTVTQKISAVMMNINIGGNNITYDSTVKDQPQNPLTDFFSALVGAEFTLTIKKADMSIEKIDGRKEFIDKLVKTNQQLDTLLKQILSDEALKQMADPTFAAIPPKGEIPKDKTWEKKAELKMGPIGNYDTLYKYTFKSEDKDLVTIDVATTLTYKAPESKSTALPFTITKGTLTSKDGKGTIVFDKAKGLIKSSKMDLTLNGELTIEIAGQPTVVTLDQTQSSILETTTTDPLKK